MLERSGLDLLDCFTLIKHTIEIAERPARISLEHKQLVLKAGDIERSYACEDMGVLILQHPAISLSAAIINALLESGCVVIFCGSNHLPTGMLLPTVTHTELVPRMMAQLAADLPAQKRVWKAIIQAKINAQAKNLPPVSQRKLFNLAQKVKSGDPENREAQAAKIYWQARFPEQYQRGIKRDQKCATLFNSALNYGYAIIRAATARALVSAGLQPALGVFHHNRGNPFCLADDVMEPLRPLVDERVKELLAKETETDGILQQSHRRELLSLLSEKVICGDFTGPLMVALPRYVSSFFQMLIKESKKLTSPTQCKSQDTDVCG